MRSIAALGAAILTFSASVAMAYDLPRPLSAYAITNSGVVRLSWDPILPLDATKDVPDIRYTVFRGPFGGALAPIAAGAYSPATTVILDQVRAPGVYVYQVTINASSTTNLPNPIPAIATQNVTVSALTGSSNLPGTTILAETFDGNRLDLSVWTPSKAADPTWMIQTGLLILAPNTSVTNQLVTPPGYTLSSNGINLVARIKATSAKIADPAVDENVGAIGFETTDASGYVLKLVMRHNGPKNVVQLQFSKKVKSSSGGGFTLNTSWVDCPAAGCPTWNPDTFYWLKLKVNQSAATPTAFAWVWADGAAPPALNDESKANLSFDFSAVGFKAEGNLPAKPVLFGDAGTVKLGEVVIEDLFPMSRPGATACNQPNTSGSSTVEPADSFVGLGRRVAHAPLGPPDLDRVIMIPMAAITPAGTGRWGTLIGRVEPDLPVSVPCPPVVCPWLTGSARTTACCTTSALAPGTVMPWSSTVNGMPMMDVPLEGTPIEGVPVEIPPGSGTPGSLPATPAASSTPDNTSVFWERRAPVARRPETMRARLVARDVQLKRSAFRPDDPAAMSDGAATRSEAPAEASPPAAQAPKAPNPNLQLPQIPATLRALRDFGAVATVPDSVEQLDQHLSRSERDLADALIDALLRSLDDFVVTNPLGIRVEIAPAARLEQFKKLLAKKQDPIDAAALEDVMQIIKDLAQKIVELKYEEFTAKLIEKRIGEYPSSEVTKKAMIAAKDAALVQFKMLNSRTEAMAGSLAVGSRSTLRFSAVPAPSYSSRSGGAGGGGGYGGNGDDRGSRDPFSFLPRVTVVPVAPTGSADASLDTESALSADSKPQLDSLYDDPNTRGWNKHGRVWTYHFDHPARFPMTRFGSNCCAFEGDGAIIHEGMRLLARQDGQYELRFNMTAPSIPVRIQLQLILFEQGRPDPRYGQPIPRTLTLPPIVLQPTGPSAFPNNLEGGVQPTSYIVSVQGYSQVIKEAQDTESGSSRVVLVKRIGTARLGSGVQYQVN